MNFLTVKLENDSWRGIYQRLTLQLGQWQLLKAKKVMKRPDSEICSRLDGAQTDDDLDKGTSRSTSTNLSLKKQSRSKVLWLDQSYHPCTFLMWRELQFRHRKPKSAKRTRKGSDCAIWLSRSFRMRLNTVQKASTSLGYVGISVRSS